MMPNDFYSAEGEFRGEWFCTDISPEEATIVLIQGAQPPELGYWLRNEDSLKIIAGEKARGTGYIRFTLLAPTPGDLLAFRDRQWLLYSCYPKALLEQAKLQGKNVTDEDFREKYAGFFKPRYYGMLKDESCMEVVFELLGRKTSQRIEGYADAMACFNDEKVPIIIHSTISLHEGDRSVIEHRTLLHEIGKHDFVVWTSYQNGTSGLIRVKAEDWTPKQCVAIPLRPA